ncbi:hypothetical protein ACS0TY_029058 [Phlomoides rotata]
MMDCCEDSPPMCRVVCPKPRRAAPLKSHIRNDAASKAGAELLGQIHRKDKFEAEQCATLSSSPPFFFGSPPCRTRNPVVQDEHFRVEKLSFIHEALNTERPAHARKQLGEKQAFVRVEGFDCCYHTESINCT